MDNMTELNDSLTYRLLKTLDEAPQLSQRARSESLQISIGLLPHFVFSGGCNL